MNIRKILLLMLGVVLVAGSVAIAAPEPTGSGTPGWGDVTPPLQTVADPEPERPDLSDYPEIEAEANNVNTARFGGYLIVRTYVYEGGVMMGIYDANTDQYTVLSEGRAVKKFLGDRVSSDPKSLLWTAQYSHGTMTESTDHTNGDITECDDYGRREETYHTSQEWELTGSPGNEVLSKTGETREVMKAYSYDEYDRLTVVNGKVWMENDLIAAGGELVWAETTFEYDGSLMIASETQSAGGENISRTVFDAAGRAATIYKADTTGSYYQTMSFDYSNGNKIGTEYSSEGQAKATVLFDRHQRQLGKVDTISGTKLLSSTVYDGVKKLVSYEYGDVNTGVGNKTTFFNAFGDQIVTVDALVLDPKNDIGGDWWGQAGF